MTAINALTLLGDACLKLLEAKQNISEKDAREAIKLLRTNNPDLFHWLKRITKDDELSTPLDSVLDCLKRLLRATPCSTITKATIRDVVAMAEGKSVDWNAVAREENEAPTPSKEQWAHPTWEPALPPPTPPPVKAGRHASVVPRDQQDQSIGNRGDNCRQCGGKCIGHGDF